MPRPPSCDCGRCETCRERARSARRREDPGFREEHRLLCQERYERMCADDPDGYRAMLDQAAQRRREARANGAGPRLREQERRRYWLARCPGRGLTLDELAARSGQPAELLATVLAAETRHRRRRVWLDEQGRYRLVADRFDEETIAALAGLAT